MPTVYVKTYGYFAYKGKKVLNPGSVVDMEEDDAEVFINRGNGELASGPFHEAPPPPELVEAEAGRAGSELEAARRRKAEADAEVARLELEAAHRKMPERPGLDVRQSKAERAVAAVQRP
jgi:hypothetical protein